MVVVGPHWTSDPTNFSVRWFDFTFNQWIQHTIDGLIDTDDEG